MSDKSILYVIGSLALGGAERHIAAIVPQLAQRGWDPTIYCLTACGEQANTLRSAGVEVVGPPLSIESRQTAVGKLARLIASCTKLLAFLLFKRPQIVHFFLPAAYLMGAPLAVVARTPIRIMSRRSLNLYQRKHPRLRRLEMRLHAHMQMLLANSRAVLDELQMEGGKTPTKLIYNGVDLSTFDASPEKHSHDPDGLTLVIVANLIPYKGHSDLFNALAQVADKLPASWELLCVGRDDGLGPQLATLADRLNIADHIRMLGSRSDIPALLTSADIGILCSHEEGFSNAILEGMAASLPMVVTDVGGNAEAVLDEETGFVVPPRDPASIGAAILRLALDPELRRSMAAAARRRAESHFSLERCVANYDALYRELAASSAQAVRVSVP